MAVRVTREKLISWGYDPDMLDRLIGGSRPELGDPTGGMGRRGPTHAAGVRVEYVPACVESLIGPDAVSLDHGPGWWEVTIDRWRPASLNELLRAVRARHRLKRRDRQVVCYAMDRAAIPYATGKRRVSLRITLPPRQRRWDKDAFWKSTLDAIVCSLRLVGDSPDWCEPGTVGYERCTGLATMIRLEDVNCSASTTY